MAFITTYLKMVYICATIVSKNSNNLMDNIINYPIIPLGIYKRYREAKRLAAHDTVSFWSVFKAIVNDCGSGNLLHQRLARLIVFDLRTRINHPSVFRENTSAKVLEDRIAYLCDGRTGDSLSKKNPNISSLLSDTQILSLPGEFRDTICDKVSSNFREKGDVIFYDTTNASAYKVSIKSLIPSNNEVNFGSFEWTSLFYGIFDEIISLGERTSNLEKTVDGVKYKMGKGSKQQLTNLFKYLVRINKLQDFFDRFEILFRGVFKEDILFYIKDHDVLKIHLMTNNEFVDCVTNSLRNNYDNKRKLVINRWEGNSIRMDRNILLSYCSRNIEIPFSNLVNSAEIIGILHTTESMKEETLLQQTY